MCDFKPFLTANTKYYLAQTMNIFGQKIKLVFFIGIFSGTFILVWAYLEPILTLLGINLQGHNKGGIYLMVMFVFCIFVAMVIAWNRAWKAKQPEAVLLAEKVRFKLKKLDGRIAKLVSGGSYFKLIYLDWRMQVELEKTQLADAGRHTLTAEDIDDYIISATYNILKRLGKNDEYVTFSNIDFWRHIHSNLHFLISNIEAVSTQGVRINRILLVDKKVLEGQAFPEEKEQIRQVVKILNDEYQKNLEAFQPGKMDWHFYLGDNFKPALDISMPYAIISNKISGECLAILPKRRKEKEKPRIEMYFSENAEDENISAYLNDFKRIAKETASLMDIPRFYHELFNGKWKK